MLSLVIIGQTFNINHFQIFNISQILPGNGSDLNPQHFLRLHQKNNPTKIGKLFPESTSFPLVVFEIVESMKYC